VHGGLVVVTDTLWRLRINKAKSAMRRAQRKPADDTADQASRPQPPKPSQRCTSTLRHADARQAQSTGVDRDLTCSLAQGHEGRHVAPAVVAQPDASTREVFAWDARGYVVRASTQGF
jgi:hypothetical protein